AGAGVALVGVLFGGWWMMAHGLSLGDAASELAGGGQPRFAWQSVDKRHWQVVTGSALEDLAVTDAREGNSAGCGAGMVRVSGAAKVGDVESAQDAACTDWISKDFPARCRAFDPAKVAEGVAALPTKAMDFCVDRFEYPNQLGQAPMIVVTFHEAEAA